MLLIKSVERRRRKSLDFISPTDFLNESLDDKNIHRASWYRGLISKEKRKQINKYSS